MLGGQLCLRVMLLVLRHGLCGLGVVFGRILDPGSRCARTRVQAPSASHRSVHFPAAATRGARNHARQVAATTLSKHSPPILLDKPFPTSAIPPLPPPPKPTSTASP